MRAEPGRTGFDPIPDRRRAESRHGDAAIGAHGSVVPFSVLIALQAATVVVPADDARGCPDRSDEIVVCHKAIDPGRYRLPMRGDDRPVPAGPPRAEWGLGNGVRMGLEAQSQAMPQGAISNRAMATVKIPF